MIYLNLKKLVSFKIVFFYLILSTNVLYCTRIRNCPLAENASIEWWFSESINRVRGEHQHYHNEQEYGNGAFEVHYAVWLIFIPEEKLIFLKM